MQIKDIIQLDNILTTQNEFLRSPETINERLSNIKTQRKLNKRKKSVQRRAVKCFTKLKSKSLRQWHHRRNFVSAGMILKQM